ncbi:MAG: molybdopterin-containing oxidoreductase family protein [Bacillota bacterium]
MAFNYEIDNGIIKTYCRMCSYHCGIEVHISDSSIDKISGCKENPFSEGKLCIKGGAIKETIFSPDRLLKPLKRKDSKWQEISLRDALDEIAAKTEAIIKQYGPEGLGVWKGESLGSGQQRDLAHRFAQALGTPNIMSNDTLCAVSKKAAVKSVLGSYPMPDIQNAESIIIWGANPLASHFPLAQKIIKARKSGLKVVLIDPRQSTFTKHTDHYIALKPASDGALALGVINLLIKNNWYDEAFIEDHALGFSELAGYAGQFTAGRVEEETGVGPDDLQMLAEVIAKSAPASAFMVGVGPEHQDNGFNNIRAIASVFALCGCIDRKGGNLLPEKAGLNSAGPDSNRNLAADPIGKDIYPVFYDNHREAHTCMALDTMLDGKPYPLRGLILSGANPVQTNPDTRKVKKALSSLELFVARDLFMTETARLADYVLPAASFLERSEVIANGEPQTIALTQKIFSTEDCIDEYSFYRSILRRMGSDELFPWKDSAELNRWILAPLGLSQEELANNPQGYQYKPIQYESFQNAGFQTPSGKVEFTSHYLKELGYHELPVYEPSACTFNLEDSQDLEKGQFIMITGARQARFNHSCYHNIPKLSKAVPEPLLEINAEDAESLGIKDDDLVDVISELGSLTIKVLVKDTEAIMNGVVQVPHGFDNGNISEIIPDNIRDQVSGFPALKSVPVLLKKAT